MPAKNGLPAEDLAKAVEIARDAKDAFNASQLLNSGERDAALTALNAELISKREEILKFNRMDLEEAKTEVDAGRLSESTLKRLDLSRSFDSMLFGVRSVAALPNPTGNITYGSELDEGLHLQRVTCPIGVLLVIFEARPEVVVNIASLAIKSGNAAILKGGKESSRTAEFLTTCVHAALAKTNLPKTLIQSVQTRSEIASLLAQDEYIDLVIPRGSNALVKSIQDSTRIPVMGHADGICNVYVDLNADEETALRVVKDSKINYVAACNAAENLLIHDKLRKTLWPKLGKMLLDEGVQLLCDPSAYFELKQLSDHPRYSSVLRATAQDFKTEHLGYVISILCVNNVSDAIKFINSHSSHHTDAIVTTNEAHAKQFVRGVDSAGVFVNASTRFADGFRYGFGTEVGISTGKIHARGPVGLEGLVTYKYVLKSTAENGHIVGEFGDAEDKKKFKHTPMPKMPRLY